MEVTDSQESDPGLVPGEPGAPCPEEPPGGRGPAGSGPEPGCLPGSPGSPSPSAHRPLGPSPPSAASSGFLVTLRRRRGGVGAQGDPTMPQTRILGQSPPGARGGPARRAACGACGAPGGATATCAPPPSARPGRAPPHLEGAPSPPTRGRRGAGRGVCGGAARPGPSPCVTAAACARSFLPERRRGAARVRRRGAARPDGGSRSEATGC